MAKSSHSLLLSVKRNNFTDTCFYGSMYFACKGKIEKFIGLEPSEICFLRSLMKPIQASIALKTSVIDNFNLEEPELAIIQGSHAGTNEHLKIIENIMKKADLKLEDLQLEPTEPLDTRDFDGTKSKLHNNCSAKHAFMLLLSKYFNFDLKDYLNPNGKLQNLIHKKQDELSNYKSEVLSFDGCGTPLWALPFQNVIMAFYNLLNDEAYEPYKMAILNNPYIFGGQNRLDTEIIELSKGKLYSKVGAGGLVLIHNIATDETLLIKMAQDNNPQRRLIALHALVELDWIEQEPQTLITNQKNQKVAKYCYEFSLK